MEKNEIQARKFLDYVNSNYEKFKKKWAKYLNEKNIKFDEDVYSDTILKVYDYIVKNGIQDDSDSGFANYFFKSFQMNAKREQLYSRNANRDLNVDASAELDTRENGDEALKKKLRAETYSDFSVIYLLQRLEPNCDSITFWCFRLYYIIPKMTYSRLREITNVKDCKKRCVTARKWLEENVSREEIDNAFEKWMEDD